MSESAAQALRGAWREGVELPRKGGRVLLGQASLSECVEYETRFGRSPLQLRERGARLLSQSQWLWRPDPFPPRLRASVRFIIPARAEISVPWAQSEGSYVLDESAFFAETFSLVGAFDRQRLELGTTTVEIARLGDPSGREQVRHWISSALRTAASVGDRFPRDRLQFVVIPVQHFEAEVAFGMVRRGGGASVLLLPSVDAELAELEADWVAVHELSHFWLPRLQADGRWLSEGIATYLQEVLRARCGLQSSEQAWRRIREGFERGRRSGSGRSLASESGAMNRTGAYQRVYWAGTAFALETDLRLRHGSVGKTTLLSVLDDAQQDWGQDVRPVSAARVLKVLSKASGEDFIEELGERYAASPDFPDTGYLDSAEYREIRAQITSPQNDACGISDESSR